MLGRVLSISIWVSLFGPILSVGQNTCGNTKLICLIPTVLHTTSGQFNFFNEAFGAQISQLPLATPASGFIYTFDRQKGVYTGSQESFGPLLAERSETIGRHKAYFAFTYQRFPFSEIDGNGLKKIPILFYFPSEKSPEVVTETTNRVDTKVDQFVAFGTFGATDWLDVSVAIPFEKISMGVSAAGTEYSTMTTAKASFNEFLAGDASGLGDVVISAKGTLLKRERYGVALGGELRFPSGDEQNFLGSGAFGLKPYVVLSRRGRIAPHLNLAYQWNANSSLAMVQNGNEQRLPGFFGYTAGADIGVTRRLTVVGDWVGQHFFDASQVTKPKTLTEPVAGKQMPFLTIQPTTGSYDVNNLALGVKANPWSHLLLLANMTIKLDEGGLRANVSPFLVSPIHFESRPNGLSSLPQLG
jgi:hypothetical protein